MCVWGGGYLLLQKRPTVTTDPLDVPYLSRNFNTQVSAGTLEIAWYHYTEIWDHSLCVNTWAYVEKNIKTLLLQFILLVQCDLPCVRVNIKPNRIILLHEFPNRKPVSTKSLINYLLIKTNIRERWITIHVYTRFNWTKLVITNMYNLQH